MRLPPTPVAAKASGALAESCWVCGAATRQFWSDRALTAVACASCGHIVAQHAPVDAQGTDYHLAYEQGDFVAALGATRRRQAQRLLDVLASLGPLSLFDFGCGRGFLIEAARERGCAEVAGGDVSELALTLLRERGVPALALDAEQPFEKLDLGQLPFVPRAITLLDVIEHFPGDLATRLRPWIDALPAGVELIAIKVPVRDGLLFSMARAARRFGVAGLGQQLFQVGTYPAHYQYFSRRSLEGLLARLGLERLVVVDDLDFEPGELARRMSRGGPALRRMAGPLGQVLGGAVRASRREDSRLVIARRVR
jgi:SAM-dependent methyltransferase